MSVTPLEALQVWYTVQCNGSWEYAHGVKIETVDNPGWTLTVDLRLTPLSDRMLDRVEIDRGKSDWVHYLISDNKFVGACGPANLDELIQAFLDFADSPG